MQELRSLAPVDCEIVIFQCNDPIGETYRAAHTFVQHPQYADHLVTRAEYLEGGSNACRRKFRDWRSWPSEAKSMAENHSQIMPQPKTKGKKKDTAEGWRPDNAAGKAVLRSKGRRK
ncbi:hypothetical protein HWV62_37119 [Athelia sp. TMB]|nr:hypothetical protein HWV62_37119 [Athelia sp. TMB]